jgi:hypothetical protein
MRFASLRFALERPALLRCRGSRHAVEVGGGPWREGDHAHARREAPRVHHAARRRGCVPFTARAQKGERVRRVGVLVGLAEDDPNIKARLAGFRTGLEKRGWSDARNIHIDYRYAPAGARLECKVTKCTRAAGSIFFSHSS